MLLHTVLLLYFRQQFGEDPVLFQHADLLFMRSMIGPQYPAFCCHLVNVREFTHTLMSIHCCKIRHTVC